MKDPDKFDAFYKDVRERLLVQTFALTGDLAASRRAVRDALVVAWHHWRKLSQLDDPETVVRPHAWRRAQRRHTARMWQRTKDLDPEVKATLDALGTLSTTQRRALLLTQLAAVSMSEMAREVGLPTDAASRELQTAAAAFSLAREVPAASIRSALEPLTASAVADVHWPRATIIRRAGAARRRAHTTVGALAAVAVLVVSGSLVTDATGVRPSLDRPTTSKPSPAPTTGSPPPEVRTLDEQTLLTPATLDRAYPRPWSVTRTNDNSTGNGMVLPCQLERYADPRGDAAFVRRFAAAAQGGQPPLTATQMTEASATSRAARRTFRKAARWYGACSDERVQLLATRTPADVGDEALLVTLGSRSDPGTTYVLAIARTGLLTTTTMVRDRSASPPDPSASARVLAQAVDGLCALPAAGACAADEPVLTLRAPVPVGPAPALVTELDLPSVTGVVRPWVGTEPRRATTNVAATRCDNTAFAGPFEGARFSNNVTRTFVVPGAALPQEFGLTETVGSLPTAQAMALVDQVRGRLASCSDKDLGTDVEQTTVIDEADRDLTGWRLTIELPDERTITIQMAILRVGTSVGQIAFIPAPRVEMPPGGFAALAQRALERLEELPPPRPGR